MSTVFVRKAKYDYSTLKPLIYEIMDFCAGDRIGKDSRVVIKPNLLAPATPDEAILTHPLIVKAAAEYVLDKGAVPQISDSPAVGSFEKIIKESGLKDALKGLNVRLSAFTNSVKIDVGEPFKKIELAEDAVRADVVINLAKLKTHTHMLLTLGIKNLFGCVVGLRKPEWHLRAGVDRDMFARMLVKVHQAVSPAVTIIDGILAMEGQGPGKRGEPRKLGVIMGGDNAADLDITVCRMLGIPPEQLLTNDIAMKEGIASGAITVDGELPRIRDYRLPEITPLVFGPQKLHGYMRRHLVQRPECDHPLCKLCGECWQYCPAEAITRKNKKIQFNYDTCIRCYCCIEVCPHGALRTRETWTGKVTRKLLKL